MFHPLPDDVFDVPCCSDYRGKSDKSNKEKGVIVHVVGNLDYDEICFGNPGKSEADITPGVTVVAFQGKRSEGVQQHPATYDKQKGYDVYEPVELGNNCFGQNSCPSLKYGSM